mmetsp:Transcript_24445/g.30075  ORF Transcript_24445/g.30075 Transcript_24445/m.30075 type:complete len:253 (-) Transcript_24445:131-889(-)
MSTLSSVSILTKRLTHLGIRAARPNSRILLQQQQQQQQLRNYALFSKASEGLNGQLRQFSSKEDDNKETSNVDPDSDWHKFQQTLKFDASTFDALPSSKLKKRGGKLLRKKKEQQLKLLNLNSNDRLLEAGSGQYPPLRYSDDETQKLLEEAYAAIPPRMGGTKTRQLKRQTNRYRSIRKARALKKEEKINHHFATMEKRSKISKEVQAVKVSAESVRNEELEYQKAVLNKWAFINGFSSSENGQEEGQKIE